MKRLFRITMFFSLIAIITAQTQDLQRAISNAVDGFRPVETAYAIGGLSVNWGVPEGNPIFTISGAVPGQDEARSVLVTNGDIVSLPVAIKGKNLTSSGGLETVLDLKISQGGVDIYGGTSPTGPKTLAQFMTDSLNPNGISLSTIGAGLNETYDITVTFLASAGNEYQNTDVEFDLVIGILTDIPVECSFIDMTGKFPIFGTGASEKIKGTTGSDVIFGLGGNDKIYAKGGRDCVIGGAGEDQIHGETGDDVLFGNEDEDTVDGGTGSDLIYGGAGNDEVDGESGDDMVNGDGGDDKVDGGSGRDILHGGDGADEMDGGAGNDDIYGENQADILDGGAGNDLLVGGADSDKLNGQAGRDTCTGEIKKNCEL